MKLSAPFDERGVALLVTLLMVTLLTIIVVEFTYSTGVDAHLTRNSLSGAQARNLARSGIALAELTLKRDAAAKAKSPPERPPIETLNDPWAQPFPPMPVAEGFGTVGFVITDPSGLYNLNALSIGTAAGPAQLEMRKALFQGILAALDLDTNLIFPLLDWLDPDDEVSSDKGAESEYYLGLTPVHLARNGRLLTFDELALVKDFGQLTPEQWTGLRGLVTVLPNSDLRINVNTAPELLLTAIFTALDHQGLGRTIVKDREEHPFQKPDLDNLLNAYQVSGIVRPIFDVRSSLFAIRASGKAGDVERGLAVTEQIRRELFPPRLEILDWREQAGGITLTSPEASGGMSPLLPP